MSQPKQQTKETVDFLTKAETFYNKNQKVVTIGLGGILLVVAGLIGFYNFYLPGQEKEAQEDMFFAQLYFERDSFNLALNGDGNYSGFLKIADKYSFTKAADLSEYYAGICYLRTGEYDKAIEYLKKFGGNDQVVSSVAIGAIGDAYSEKGDVDEAVSYYKKAAKNTKNELTTPYYLFKAGLALKSQAKNSDALALFEEIKKEYPESSEGREIEKYIAMVK